MDQPSDIRNLSADRPLTAPIVELRSPAQLPADVRDAIEPISARFGRPQMVIREHTNNAVRWKQGERLNHLLERPASASPRATPSSPTPAPSAIASSTAAPTRSRVI